MATRLSNKPSLMIIVLMILQVIWIMFAGPFLFFDLYPSQTAEPTGHPIDTAVSVAWLLTGLVASVSILTRRAWGWWFEFAFVLRFAIAGIVNLAIGHDFLSAVPIAIFGLAAPSACVWMAIRFASSRCG